MKIMTVLGTRPEIIRLSMIIPLLDKHSKHILVHTGQNYDKRLKDIFFKELGVREPDYSFSSKSSTTMGRVGKILTNCEEIFKKEKPDRLLLLGDTNSALCAYTAKRMGIDVYHMEAGNRCYDDRVPEEVNRRVIDHSSDVLMPYTERSRENLLREGIEAKRIYVVGNPICEVLLTKELEYTALSEPYFLVTLHREENVDNPGRLDVFLKALIRVYKKYKRKIYFSVHPRTRAVLETNFPLYKKSKAIEFMEPMSFVDFVSMEKCAMCVLSDSGTVQEECCIFKVPNVTLRDVTERPETVEVGSNIIAGSSVSSIMRAVDVALNSPCSWNPPPEYMKKDVSHTVLRIMLGEKP